jgi:hypothetical protein
VVASISPCVICLSLSLLKQNEGEEVWRLRVSEEDSVLGTLVVSKLQSLDIF